MADINIAMLQSWVGRTKESREKVSPRLIAQMTATLSPHIYCQNSEDIAPPSFQWLLSPDAVASDGLGVDGHVAKGGFLPPVPLPRRMWAGGVVKQMLPFNIGDTVLRHSEIIDVTRKDGRSGTLVFVKVEHSYRSERGLHVQEQQDIVYRSDVSVLKKPISVAPQKTEKMPDAALQWEVESSPQLLFRYSALTFNSHRIHYDYAYATEQEHYQGLVVQGPLQATLLSNLAAQLANKMPSEFSYKGVAPLICGDTFKVSIAQPLNNVAQCWVSDAKGVTTMRATASWKND